jgi:alpha-L-fucosidase
MKLFFIPFVFLALLCGQCFAGEPQKPAPGPMPGYLQGYETLWEKNPHAAALAWFKQVQYGMFVSFSPASQVGQAAWQKADAQWTLQWHAKNATLPADKYDRYMADKFDGKLMSPSAGKLLRSFTAKTFDADKIVDLAVASRMKYIIFTSHHVLGRMYLFKTSTSSLNSVALAPQRDFVAELAKACQSRNLGLFLYVGPPYTTPIIRERYRTMLAELLTQYGPIAGLWFDGIGEAYRRPSAFEPAEVSRTYDLVRKLQPQCLISFKSGYTGEEDFLAPEWHQFTYGPDGLPRIGKYGPDSVPDNIPPDIFKRWNKTLRHLFAETSTTMLYKKGHKSAELWFDEPGALAQHKTAEDVIAQYNVVRTRSQNFVLNIALRGDGSIHPDDCLVLREVGQHLATQNRKAPPPVSSKEQEQPN